MLNKAGWLGILMVMLIAIPAWSCQISIDLHEDTDATLLAQGSEVIFKVEVRLNHRNCSHPLEETQFSGEGLELIAATPWKENASTVWVRWVKARITAESSCTAVLHVRRVCHKGGASEDFEFTVK
jgi:hypothetical protein